MKVYQQKQFSPNRCTASSQHPRHTHCHHQKSFEDQSPHRSPHFRHQKNSYTSSFDSCGDFSPQVVQNEPVWQQLYQHGLQSQRELHETYLRNQNKLDKQCTFHPFLIRSNRYLLGSSTTFLTRVTAWHQQKIEKIVKEKEHITHKGLQQCTFTPKINRNSHRLPSGKQNRIQTVRKFEVGIGRSRLNNPYYIQKKSHQKCDASRTKQGNTTLTVGVGLEKVKKHLRDELREIEL